MRFDMNERMSVSAAGGEESESNFEFVQQNLPASWLHS